MKEDVDHRVKAGWKRWEMTSGVLGDKRMLIWLKVKYHKTIVQLTRLCDIGCLVTTTEHTQDVGHKLCMLNVKIHVWQNL